MDTVKAKRKSKNKIRVDFERAPLLQRLKAKFWNMYFVKRMIFLIFKLVLLIGVSYVILYPYITKIFGSFMTASDFKDVTVILVSKNPILEQYKYIITENGYFTALLNTFLVSLSLALIQTLVCALIAYGSAIMGTATILIALPLILTCLFVQNYIVQGIEHSDIVG